MHNTLYDELMAMNKMYLEMAVDAVYDMERIKLCTKAKSFQDRAEKLNQGKDHA